MRAAGIFALPQDKDGELHGFPEDKSVQVFS